MFLNSIIANPTQTAAFRVNHFLDDGRLGFVIHKVYGQRKSQNLHCNLFYKYIKKKH